MKPSHANDGSEPARRRSPLSAVDVAGPEWAAWYALTPQERFDRSMELWQEYVALGGSLDPEVDTQSPFWSREDLECFAKRVAGAAASTYAPWRDRCDGCD